MKKCTDCGQVKDETEFYVSNKHTGKRYGRCKDCYKNYAKERSRSIAEKFDPAIYAKIDIDKDVKFCPRCKEYKPLREFKKDRYRLDGFHGYCTNCVTFDSAYYTHRSRARITATLQEVDALYSSHPHCHYCKRPLEKYEVSFDHKEPLVGDYSGDKTSIDNLTISCWDCNRLKWTMSEQQFFDFLRAYRDRLNNAELGN